MDKIMSTRMDEAVIRRIGLLAQKLGKSKKHILESAVNCFAEKMSAEKDLDAFVQTLGSWVREDSPAESVERIRATMKKSQERYKR
jgi:hypothetical protein